MCSLGRSSHDGFTVTAAAPFLAAARLLIARGAPPTATLVMRWEGSPDDALFGPIGPASRLKIAGHGGFARAGGDRLCDFESEAA